MSLFAIVLVYLTLDKPTRVVVPAQTAALETHEECVGVAQRLLATHAFDRPGMQLVYAGCQAVVPFYRKDGTQL